jgi:enoyl-CoA hydratase
MRYEYFTVSTEGAIATVTFERPPVNAFNEASRFEIIDIFDRLSEDDTISVVIFTAKGKYFSGGADIKERVKVRPDQGQYRAVNRMSLASVQAVRECRKPVIGVLNGPAIGAGGAFITACDMIVAAEDAYLWMPEIDRGMVGGPALLARAFTPWRARWAFLTSSKIPASELHRLDVVQEVAPRDEIMDVALGWAKLIAEKPPLAVEAAKEMFNMAEVLPFREAASLEANTTVRLSRTEDSREAQMAFVEKRAPVFRRR